MSAGTITTADSAYAAGVGRAVPMRIAMSEPMMSPIQSWPKDASVISLPSAMPRPVVRKVWIMMPIAASAMASDAATITPSRTPRIMLPSVGRKAFGRKTKRAQSAQVAQNAEKPTE